MKNKQITKNSSLNFKIMIIIGLLLLLTAMLIRYFGPVEFYNISMKDQSSKRLFSNYPNVISAFFEAFMQFFSIYLKGYIVPVFLFLVPSILLLHKGVAGLKLFVPTFLKEQITQKKQIYIIFFTSLIIVIFVQQFGLVNFPLITDEYSCLFQADIMQSGKLYSESFPTSRSITPMFVVADNIGKVYSKYTIGWPFLLAVGKLIHLQFLVNPIFTALSAVLLFLIQRKINNEKGGVLTAVLAIVSPFFICMGASYFTHTSLGFFMLLYIYSILKISSENSTKFLLIAGISAMFMEIIRPSDGAVICASLFPFTVHYLYRRFSFTKTIQSLFIISACLIVGTGLLMLVNKIQTGDPWLFGFIKYDPNETIGFGSMKHTPLKGLWNLIITVFRNSFWTAPFLISGMVLAFFKKGAQKRILIYLPIAGFSLFYFFYYGIGGSGFGSRYYYPAFLTLIIAAVDGFLYFEEILKRKYGELNARTFIPVFTFATTLFMVFAVYTYLLPDLRKSYKEDKDFFSWLIDNPKKEQQGLIFVRESPLNITRWQLRNQLDFTKQKHLISIFLSPDENEALIKKFPKRKPYILIFNKEEGIRLIDYPAETKIAQNYILAGLNYQMAIYDEKKAELSFKKALEIEPDNPLAIYNLGSLCFVEERYKEAVEWFTKFMKIKNNYGPAYYFYGLSLAKTGNIEKAVKSLYFYLTRFPGSKNESRAKKWLDFYKTKT